MSLGIYRVANARVKEQTIALLNSIWLYDPETAIGMIPGHENSPEIAEIVPNQYAVQISIRLSKPCFLSDS
ncbi:hypothetical protein NG799_23220 [Laspinema sp. D1]|uniref:Uncharacterized protein n=1 Tax=Laspinema palackyanum D2a TaxID=2953684 RepID=A0ABT2N0H0_9CYAN|nr:hypothetical protein [Laspinema sp. D2b]MCT7969231.1 hypothetical protein [Laspinema sp. D2a]